MCHNYSTRKYRYYEPQILFTRKVDLFMDIKMTTLEEKIMDTIS